MLIFKKISDVVDNDVVKNTVYNELVSAIHNTDTSNLVRNLTMTQKSVKLKRKYLRLIMVNILLHKDSIRWWQKSFLQD